MSRLEKGPGYAGFVLDLDNSREAELSFGDSGYFVAFDGTPMVRIADENHVFVSAELDDLAARIYEEEDSWQAELRLDPAIFVQVGLSPLSITIAGSGFRPGARVRWNNTLVPTTYIDQSKLEIRVAAHHLYGISRGTISAENRPLSRGISNNITVEVASIPPLHQIFVPLIMSE